jgi:hypothetical protein
VTQPALPAWASELITLYESSAACQFILHGNVADRVLIPHATTPTLGSLAEFLSRVLLKSFDVVITYDLAAGIRIDKGGDAIQQWPVFKQTQTLPREPRQAIEWITSFLRYSSNLQKLGRPAQQVASVHPFREPRCPCHPRCLQLRPLRPRPPDPRVGSDSTIAAAPVATFLITDNLSDLHPLIVSNPRAARFEIPLPSESQLKSAFEVLAPSYPNALKTFADNLDIPAGAMSGATMHAVEGMLKTREHKGQPIADTDLVNLKKQIIENEAGGLLEFVQSDRNLDMLLGQEKVKAWLRQDLQLWRQDDLQAMPMGYLICGPGRYRQDLHRRMHRRRGRRAGGEAQELPRQVGRLDRGQPRAHLPPGPRPRPLLRLRRRGRPVAGQRDAGGNDGGIGGRIYAMLAQEMSDTGNRGKVVWILATSRPDLVEVDLKRPGRVDVKIPLLPTTTAEESFSLIKGLCAKRGAPITDDAYEPLKHLMPRLLTPGAAEAIAVKVYRTTRTRPDTTAQDALMDVLDDYQHPIPSMSCEHRSNSQCVNLPMQNLSPPSSALPERWLLRCESAAFTSPDATPQPPTSRTQGSRSSPQPSWRRPRHPALLARSLHACASRDPSLARSSPSASVRSLSFPRRIVIEVPSLSIRAALSNSSLANGIAIEGRPDFSVCAVVPAPA